VLSIRVQTKAGLVVFYGSGDPSDGGLSQDSYLDTLYLWIARSGAITANDTASGQKECYNYDDFWVEVKYKNAKHILTNVSYAKQLHVLGRYTVIHLPTKLMWADMLTKPLHGSLF
jgi:hypothetical protein